MSALCSDLQDSSSSDDSDDDSKSRSKGWVVTVCLVWKPSALVHHMRLPFAPRLVNIDPGVLCVGLVQTRTRALVQEVARLALQQRRKETVTSPCQTMSPVTKSRAENLQTSTLFTIILIYLSHFMQEIFLTKVLHCQVHHMSIKIHLFC